MTVNIKDVSPLLAPHFLDIEADPSLFKINNKLINEHSDKIGLYSKYLGHLHDSLILQTDLTLNKFSLILNDFTTYSFASAIVEKHAITIDHDKLIFPIQLNFKISDLSFNAVDEEGNIKRIKRTRIDEYLYDRVITVDSENICIGLVFYNDNKTRRRKQILILLTAQNISLEEHQKEAWNNLLGDKYDDCYNYFRAQFNKGRYLSDYTECKNLVDEYFEKD